MQPDLPKFNAQKKRHQDNQTWQWQLSLPLTQPEITFPEKSQDFPLPSIFGSLSAPASQAIQTRFHEFQVLQYLSITGTNALRFFCAQRDIETKGVPYIIGSLGGVTRGQESGYGFVAGPILGNMMINHWKTWGLQYLLDHKTCDKIPRSDPETQTAGSSPRCHSWINNSSKIQAMIG